MAEHKSANGFAYGTTHDSDCPACVAQDATRRERHGRNPHRPGTKAAARWERDEAAARWACDPRSETYWCM
jgi:hypothetical protein